MTPRRAAVAAALAVTVAAIAWLLFVGLPRWYGPRKQMPAAAASPPATPGRKIKVRLFYIAENGEKLTGVERDIAYGEGTVEQAREIVNAQLTPAAEPLVSAVPPGTSLRALFVTPTGQAYVNLSGDIVRAHPGGTLNELLTVYTLVNALTTNLPAVATVQILIDGKQVDTLAGHVDLRRPLAKNLDLVEQNPEH
jgi:spore germination protein GerM